MVDTTNAGAISEERPQEVLKIQPFAMMKETSEHDERMKNAIAIRTTIAVELAKR